MNFVRRTNTRPDQHHHRLPPPSPNQHHRRRFDDQPSTKLPRGVCEFVRPVHIATRGGDYNILLLRSSPTANEMKRGKQRIHNIDTVLITVIQFHLNHRNTTKSDIRIN